MSSPESSACRPLRVLCVEDHADSLSILKRLLTLQRHEVRGCTTAGEAHAALQCDGAERYDLLIADLTLPDGDGIDLMRQATRLGIPGIAVSARTGAAEHERSRAAGFFEHLDKPVVYEALTVVIDRVIPR
jgi:CheY-like chemotaxis protein